MIQLFDTIYIFAGVPSALRAADPQRDPQGLYGRQEGLREDARVP